MLYEGTYLRANSTNGKAENVLYYGDNLDVLLRGNHPIKPGSLPVANFL